MGLGVSGFGLLGSYAGSCKGGRICLGLAGPSGARSVGIHKEIKKERQKETQKEGFAFPDVKLEQQSLHSRATRPLPPSGSSSDVGASLGRSCLEGKSAPQKGKLDLNPKLALSPNP